MEAAAATITDASSELRWLVERLGGGEVIFRGQGRCSITLSYARLGRGGGGGGVRGYTPEVAEAEVKMEVVGNREKVK